MKPMRILGLACGLVVSASSAHAYIGPGAGLGAIGAVLAVGVALILLIVGFVWYPMKRLLKGRKSRSGIEIEKAPDEAKSDRPS